VSTRHWLLLLVAGALAGCSNGVGELCATNQPCVEPLRCMFPTGTATTGMCDYPPRAYGDRCALAMECEESLTCSSHFTSGQRYGTCIHRRKDGEACAVDRDCVSGHCEGAGSDGGLGVCGTP